jgi:hypothetical protein
LQLLALFAQHFHVEVEVGPDPECSWIVSNDLLNESQGVFLVGDKMRASFLADLI